MELVLQFKKGYIYITHFLMLFAIYMGVMFYSIGLCRRVSYQKKAYFNIITKEKMIDPPPAAAPSGDQLAMKNKGKKKKKIQKTTGISFATLLTKKKYQFDL